MSLSDYSRFQNSRSETELAFRFSPVLLLHYGSEILLLDAVAPRVLHDDGLFGGARFLFASSYIPRRPSTSSGPARDARRFFTRYKFNDSLRVESRAEASSRHPLSGAEVARYCSSSLVFRRATAPRDRLARYKNPRLAKSNIREISAWHTRWAKRLFISMDGTPVLPAAASSSPKLKLTHRVKSFGGREEREGANEKERRINL